MAFRIIWQSRGELKAMVDENGKRRKEEEEKEEEKEGHERCIQEAL